MGASSLAELRAKSAQDMLQAAIKSPITFGFGVVDGYVVPEHPAKAYAQGRFTGVPLLVGSNQDEGTLFAARLVKWGPETPSYADRIRAQFKDQADAVLKLYPPGATEDEDKATYAALFGDEIILRRLGVGGARLRKHPDLSLPFLPAAAGCAGIVRLSADRPGGLSQRGTLLRLRQSSGPRLAMGGRRSPARRRHDVVLGQFRQDRQSKR